MVYLLINRGDKTMTQQEKTRIVAHKIMMIARSNMIAKAQAKYNYSKIAELNEQTAKLIQKELTKNY